MKRAGWKFWRVRESEFDLDPDVALESLWIALMARGIRPYEFSSPGGASAGTAWQANALSGEEGLDGLDDGDAASLIEK